MRFVLLTVFADWHGESHRILVRGNQMLDKHIVDTAFQLCFRVRH
jgi:hypothetical protein